MPGLFRCSHQLYICLNLKKHVQHVFTSFFVAPKLTPFSNKMLMGFMLCYKTVLIYFSPTLIESFSVDSLLIRRSGPISTVNNYRRGGLNSDLSEADKKGFTLPCWKMVVGGRTGCCQTLVLTGSLGGCVLSACCCCTATRPHSCC